MDESRYFTEQSRQPHFLYIVKFWPYFKVAISRIIKDRIYTMRGGNPFKNQFILYWTIRFKYAVFIEKAVHEKLAQYHRGGRGT